MKKLAIILAAGALVACGGPQTITPAPVAASAVAPHGIVSHGRATWIYVAGLRDASGGPPSGSAVATFYALHTGNVPPDDWVSGSNTQLYGPRMAAVDSSGGFWTCNSTGQFLQFAPAANGNVAPVTTMSGSNLKIDNCTSMALDASGDVFGVAGTTPANSSLNVWNAAKAHGNATPSRRYAGSKTGLDEPVGVVVDPSGLIWVTNDATNSLEAFGPGTGNVKPVQLIQGSSTMLGTPEGVAIDPISHDIVLANFNGQSILYFAPSANGNVAPVKTIAGTNTKIEDPVAVAFDAAGYLYVSQCGTSGSPGSILVFKKGAKGNVAPVQDIGGPNSWFTCFAGLTVQ